MIVFCCGGSVADCLFVLFLTMQFLFGAAAFFTLSAAAIQFSSSFHILQELAVNVISLLKVGRSTN